MNTYYVYMMTTWNNTALYTGITNDLEKRLEAHRSGKGAKYTRGRGPLELVYQETCDSHGEALRREHSVKKLSREEKLTLIFQKKSDI